LLQVADTEVKKYYTVSGDELNERD